MLPRNHTLLQPHRATESFRVGPATLLFLGIFGLSLCLTNLFLGMRLAMKLEGWVASGGPYVIAHPAPAGIWIIPVSILAGILFLFLGLSASGRTGGPNFIVLAWPALFLSLGWNFMEFGFRPPGGTGLAWGWLVCGVVFIAMGGIPLVIVLGQVIKALRAGEKIEIASDGHPAKNACRKKASLIFFLQAAAVAGGILASTAFVRAVTADRPGPSSERKGEYAWKTRSKTAAQPVPFTGWGSSVRPSIISVTPSHSGTGFSAF